jgi:predicted ATP-dependent endonuclease of OLD family
MIRRLLQKITFQKEIRPNVKDLADELIQMKNIDIARYNRINEDFSTIFPSVYFDAYSHDDNSESTIEIKEKQSSRSESTKHAFNILESASGYREVLYLLSQRSQNEDNILVLDEPALHLHPNKIRHLGRLLSSSSRQIILITHSPYFVDVTMFGLNRSLIYVRRNKNRSSKAISRTGSSIDIKSYIFDPACFFSINNILVEGPGDAAVFFAISDALNSVFEKYNVTVINATGVGHVDPYVKIMEDYNVSYIALVDEHYEGKYKQSRNLVRLKGKLEHELNRAGWNGSLETSIDPDEAYDFVFQTIRNGNKDKIRALEIGNIFDESLKRIGENPDDLWMLV